MREYFPVFFSACFLGVQKPHTRIYCLALDLSQRALEEGLFIDDRALNPESARSLGLHTIQFAGAAQREADWRSLGVEL